MTRDFDISRAALSAISNADFVSKGKVTQTALKVVRTYKKKYRETDLSKAAVLGDKKLMVARVQNAIVHQLSQEIKETYSGEYYIWLPTDAAEPDPIHALNYGKTFQIGVGEMPGERYGCQCGMQILVKGTKLAI